MSNTIDDAEFVLIDTFPGVVTDGNHPSDFTAYSDDEDFPIGTKRAIYSDTQKAWTTFMYAKLIGGTDGAAQDSVVKDIVGVDTVNAADGQNQPGWAVTVVPDGGECLLTGPIGLILGAIVFATAATIKYGWIQVGGPPNVDLVSGLDGNYLTDGTVVAEAGMKLADGTGHCVFALAAAADVGLISALSGVTDVA